MPDSTVPSNSAATGVGQILLRSDLHELTERHRVLHAELKAARQRLAEVMLENMRLRRQLDHYRSTPGISTNVVQLPVLTERERAVLALIADGLTTREIGERLGISFKTASSHRYHIMDKLDARNTAAMIRVALERGLIA